MKKKILQQRVVAVHRYHAGEIPQTICASLGKTNLGCTNGCPGILRAILPGATINLGDRVQAPSALLLRSKGSWK
jgi:hypothetical protein